MPPEVEPVMPPTHMNRNNTTWAAGTHRAKSPGAPATGGVPEPARRGEGHHVEQGRRATPIPTPWPSPVNMKRHDGGPGQRFRARYTRNSELRR